MWTPETDKPQVWSSGGGVQSTAIAALICQGKLPKPDLALIADTGREHTPVWAYLENVVRPALRDAGVELHIASHDLSTVDLWSGKAGDTLLIPAYTDAAKSGREGRLPKYCSQEWKTRVVQRFCREQGIRDADLWIGFTIDEMERMRAYRDGQPWQHVYPLVHLRLSRGDCLSAIEKMGWPPPARSACWMCPFRSDREWLHLKKTAPEDFQAAVELEREVRQRDPSAFLHKSLVPLDEVEFLDQPDLFAKSCDAGGCFT